MSEVSKLSVLKAALASVPKTERRQGHRLKDIQLAAAPVVLQYCLANERFDAADVLRQIGSPLSIQDPRPIGLALGYGVSGKGGLNLQREGTSYLPCVENAAAVIALLDVECSLNACCESLGCTRDELSDRVSTLHAVTDRGSVVLAALVGLLNG